MSLYSTAGYRQLGLNSSTDKATLAQTGRSSEPSRTNTYSAPYDSQAFDGSTEFSRRQDNASGNSGYWNQPFDKRQSTQPYDSASVRQTDQSRTSERWKDNESSSAGYQRPAVEDNSWNSGVKKQSRDNSYDRTQSRDSEGNSSVNVPNIYGTYGQEQAIPGLDMLPQETAGQPGLLSRESLQTAFQSGGMRQSIHELGRQSGQMTSKTIDTSRGMSSDEQRVDTPDRRSQSSTYGQRGMESQAARRLPSDSYEQQKNWTGQSLQPGSYEQRDTVSSDNYQQPRNVPGNYKQPETASTSVENPHGRGLPYRDYDERRTGTPEQAVRSSNYGETQVVSKAVESQQGRKWPYDQYENQGITSKPPGSQQPNRFGELGTRSKPMDSDQGMMSANRGQPALPSAASSGNWPGRGMPTDDWQRQGLAPSPRASEGNRPGMTRDAWQGDEQGKWASPSTGQPQYAPPTAPWVRPHDASTAGNIRQPPQIAPLLQIHPTGSLHQKSVQQKSAASRVDQTQQEQSPSTQRQESNQTPKTSSALLPTPQDIFKQPRPALPQFPQRDLPRSGCAMPLTPQEIIPQKGESAKAMTSYGALQKCGSGILQEVHQKSASGMLLTSQGILQKTGSSMSPALQAFMQRAGSLTSQPQASTGRYLPRGTVYCSVSNVISKQTCWPNQLTRYFNIKSL